MLFPKPYRVLLLGTVATLAAVPTSLPAQTAARTAVPGPTDDAAATGEDAPDVIVTGFRQSLANSAQIKRNATEIVDSITAEDIGKLPDPNVAETLTRVPGVQGYRFAGESASPAGVGSGLTIRGLSGQTGSRLDGRAFFTAGQREYSLDQAAPGVVARIDVFKNPAASNVEGGLAGLIDVRTRRPLDIKGLTIGLGASGRYNDLARKAAPDLNVLVSNRWDMPGGGEIGILAGASYQKSWNRSDNTPSNGGSSLRRAVRADAADYLTSGGNAAFAGRTDVWQLADVPNPLALSETQRQSLITAVTQVANYNEEEIERTRKGANFAIQYKPNPTLEFYADGNYNYYEYHQRYRFLNAADSRTVQNLVTTPFTLTEALANRNANGGANEILAGQRLVSGTFLNSRLTTTGGEERSPSTTYLVAAGAKWYPTDHFEALLDVSYINAESSGNNRSVQITPLAGLSWSFARNLDTSPHDITITGPALNDPSNFYFDNYNNGGRTRTEDDGIAIQIDLKRTFDDSPITALRAGGRYATHTNLARNFAVNTRFLTTDGLAPNATQSNTTRTSTLTNLVELSSDNFLNGLTNFPGGILTFTPDQLGGDNVGNTFPRAGIPREDALPENVLARREFDEKTYAGYATADFRLLNNLITGNIGVRVVKTDTFTRAQVTDTTTTPSRIVPNERNTSYTDVLPSFNMTGKITDTLQVRLGYGKGITRPDLGSLNPVINVSAVAGTGSRGNPDLRPQRADSYDVSLEQYFSAGGYVAANLFYKDISGFFSGIEQCLTVPTAPAYAGGIINNCPAGQYRITQTVNAQDGFAKGVEVSAQTFFDFDFIPNMLRNFGVSGSYTYVKTVSPVTLNGLLVRVPQPFASENSWSLAGLYEDSIFSARVVYTYRSDFVLFGVSPNPIDGRYVGGYGILDASLNLNLARNLTASITASNLLDKGPDRFVGEPGVNATPLERQFFRNGRIFGASLRYRFGD